MRHIASLLLAVQALAQPAIDQGVDFTFASAAGGTKTLVGWNYTGNWTSAQGWQWTGSNFTSMGFGVGWNLPVDEPMFVSIAARNASLAVDNTLFSLVNLTTSQVSTGSVLHVESTVGAFAGENFYFNVNLNVSTGDFIRIVPSSGSAVIDLAFSEFNPGAYQQVTYGSFQGSGTVAGAVPEPSTYGLAIAAIALAGAFTRRRASRA